MQLFNKGKRAIVLAGGKRIEAGEIFEVSKEVAKTLTDLYPEEIVAPPVADNKDKKANETIELLKADLQAVTKERDELVKQRDELIKERDELVKKIEKANK